MARYFVPSKYSNNYIYEFERLKHLRQEADIEPGDVIYKESKTPTGYVVCINRNNSGGALLEDCSHLPKVDTKNSLVTHVKLFRAETSKVKSLYEISNLDEF